MTRIQRLLAALVACLIGALSGVSILAQEKQNDRTRSEFERPPFSEQRGPRPGRRGFPSDPTFRFIGEEMRFGGATVKGAPYSATAITETVQTLRDGSKITHKTEASVYRDAEGRTRREQTLSAIGPFAAAGEPRTVVYIQDPVAGAQFVLDPAEHTARKMRSWSGPPPEHRQPSSLQVKTESLGTQTIEGVEAEGTRTTLTIPAGQIGNDRAIDIVSERWYSSALQEVVLSRHTDPRMGEHTYRLTNINRTEPARTLFDVPADYTVQEGPMRGIRKRGS